MNHRTITACYDSRRMGMAVEEYRDADVDGDEPGDDAGKIAEVVLLEQRLTAPENENRDLREVTEGLTVELEKLERRIGAPEEGERHLR